MLTDQRSVCTPDPARAGVVTAVAPRALPWRGMAWAAFAAVALHLVVLTAWQVPVAAPPAMPTMPVRLQARMLPPDPALVASPTEAAAATPPASPTTPAHGAADTPAQAAAPAPVPAVRPAPPVLAATPAAQAADTPAPAPAELAATEPDAPVMPATSLDAVLAMAPPAAGPPRPAGAVSEDEAAPPPVYATRFAPPVRLVFRLQRGMLRGDAVLNWQHGAGGPGAGSYQLGLEARAAGLGILSQTSQGAFDAAGLAPLRFTDRRLRGSTRATSFLRERGIVSFSGPTVQYPLFPGAQDRLSWMLQLPAIVAALPAARRATTEVELHVFGARGDLSRWQFREQAAEPVMTDRGPVAAVKWLRAPRASHDTQVEIWLDPALHYLPIKVRIGNPPDGETLELLREAAS